MGGAVSVSFAGNRFREQKHDIVLGALKRSRSSCRRSIQLSLNIIGVYFVWVQTILLFLHEVVVQLAMLPPLILLHMDLEEQKLLQLPGCN